MNNNRQTTQMTATANPFMQSRQGSGGGGLVEVEQQRAIQEVQASLIIAKKFPRDPFAAFNRIMDACKRPILAESSMYAYPRGGTMVTGPSIRLAEAIAQNWGNLNFGIRELSSKDGASEIEAFAWDLETNTRQVKVFRVVHERHTKHGKKTLTDPRDVYEMVANQGARRLRACILGVIPGDVIDAAVQQCEQTLSGGGGQSIQDQIRKVVYSFAKVGVTVEMLEKRLGHNLDATNSAEVVQFGKIYRSIRDGMAKREDFFEFHSQHGQPDEGAGSLNDRLNQETVDQNTAQKSKPGTSQSSKKPTQSPAKGKTNNSKPTPPKPEKAQVPEDEGVPSDLFGEES